MDDLPAEREKMMNGTRQSHQREVASRGQALVLVVLALVAMLAMAGLVIDGGNLFAQQRKTQNWTDGAANAGAVELLRRLIGVSDPDWDSRVEDAVNLSIAADGLGSIPLAEYTDIGGNPYTPSAVVGGGTIPADAAGVHVVGQRSVAAYLAGIVGFSTFTATAEATAITGYANGVGPGVVLPLTFPVLFTRCDGNDLVVSGKWPVGPSNPLVVPMCSNGPGNVGWIDWTPTAGGASELADSIENPDNPAISTKRWYYVTATGAISAGPVQTAMEGYIGEDISLPIFYALASDPLPGTCNSTPIGDQKDLEDCPLADRGGNGSNQWYYLVTFASFHLQEVYLNGGDGGACDPGEISGKTISGCLIGYFNADVVPTEMTVDAGGGPPESNLTPPTIQLIK